MDTIEIIKKELEPLLQMTFISSDAYANSDLEYIIKTRLLELNETTDLKVIGKSNIRSFADIEVVDGNKFYKIDINTHEADTVISLPSLMSIKRAKDFLKNTNNFITYIFVDYKIVELNKNPEKNKLIQITKISVQNIESLDWSYLSIQNLGKGQLQMKNVAKELTFNNNMTRKEWLNILNIKGSIYYENLLLKITEYKTKWEEENK